MWAFQAIRGAFHGRFEALTGFLCIADGLPDVPPSLNYEAGLQMLSGMDVADSASVIHKACKHLTSTHMATAIHSYTIYIIYTYIY